MDVNVKVAVRCRPMSGKETARGCNSIVEILGNSLVIHSPDSSSEDKTFTFDYVYGGDSTQQMVYNDLGRPIITQALDGFNGTIFAYGQTGSGKTFSMMGYEEQKGIIPQLNDDLWVKIQEKINKLNEQIAEQQAALTNATQSEKEKAKPDMKFMITVSFLEVYNEDIKDLLNPSDKKLKIHESPQLGIYVDGLCELVVRDAADVMRLIYQGTAVRHVAATQMNDQSSRSHSVFTIKIEQRTVTNLSDSRQREQMVKAKVNLVDLAGSERAGKTGATGATLKEGANINKSLMTLGNVINLLAEGVNKKNGTRVIPYRESKLTRLLQESLGGNSATIMIASISPADYNYQETVSTLKYANRAKSIENAVTRNEDSSERMIRDLQQQIEALKAQLAASASGAVPGAVESTGDSELTQQQIAMNEELQKKLKEMEESQLSAWEEKERLSKQLELERQQNVNTVMSQMMQDVKQQKVLHMKNIKRLTNEKALLTKNYKEMKDSNSALKVALDEHIARYQQLQSQFDSFEEENFEEGLEGKSQEEIDRIVAERQAEHDKNTEELANEMVPLLTKIEQDRQLYMDQREQLNRMKTRLSKIEGEITEERAELVATAGILQQNDKIREQIQEEERLKMQQEFDTVMKSAQEKLEAERREVRETISLQMEEEMNKLKTELKMCKSLLKMEESKNQEYSERIASMQDYTDQLEQRLADSEVAQEASQEEIESLKHQIEVLEQENHELHDHNATLSEELLYVQKDGKAKIEMLQNNHEKMLEEAKFDIFCKIMDQCRDEKKEIEKKLKESQALLAQATKVCVYFHIMFYTL